MKYRSDIDGLRAIAILPVVLFHIFPETFPGGFVGVDVFFVISGYLISEIIFRHIEAGDFSISKFYQKRILRILPALTLVLISCSIAGWFLLLPDEYQQLGKHIFGGSVFSSNIILNSERGYFDNLAETKPLLNLWSLAVEEQFYLIWPLLLILAKRVPGLFKNIFIGVLFLSFALNIYLIGNDPEFAFYSISTRAWELMIGALYAFIVINNSRFLRASPNLMSLTGFVLLIMGFVFIDKSRAFPGWWALLPSLGAFFVLCGQHSVINTNLLSNKALIFVGLISYPLYLWHWPLISFSYILQAKSPTMEIRLGVLVASFIAAYFTYRFVEIPIRFGKNNIVFVKFLVLILVFTGFIGAIIFKSDGFPFRLEGNIKPNVEAALGQTYVDKSYSELPPAEVNKKSIDGQSDPLVPIKVKQHKIYSNTDPYKEFVGPLWKYATNKECMNSFPYDDAKNYMWWFCSLSKKSKPSVLLWGNSHTNSLYPGLVNVFPNHTFLSFGTCALERVDPRTRSEPNDTTPCDGYRLLQQQTYINDVLLKNKSIKYVFVVPTTDSKYDDDRVARFKQTVDFIEAYGAKVILFLPLVSPSYDVKGCLSRPSHPAEYDCKINSLAHTEKQMALKPLLDSLKKSNPKVGFFDMNNVICDDKYCSFLNDGMPIFRDQYFHTSEYGSNLIALYFEEWVKKNAPDFTKTK